MLWSGYYVCVSVKLGVKKKDGRPLELVRAEIMAEARAGLGRFALPVLVRGGIPHWQAETIARESIDKEPLEIGLCLLDQPALLRELIEKAMEARRTLR